MDFKNVKRTGNAEFENFDNIVLARVIVIAYLSGK
jgi:hypothetical protein